MEADVLMPIYNTPLEWVKLAVASIRNQTVTGHTLVIVDDNNAAGELRDFIYEQAACKCKTVVVRTDANRGLAAALDKGLQACTGDIVIRMDADDIAHRSLVRKHIEFFTANPGRHICGVQVRLFSNSRTWKSHHPRMVTRQLAASMSGHWFINHPGVAFRRRTLINLGGYGDTPPHLAEDYALWVKFLMAGYIIYNREEYLLDYRVHGPMTDTSPDRSTPGWAAFLREQKSLLNG